MSRGRAAQGGVGELLWRAGRLYERGWDEALARVGMTRSQAALLSLLEQEPGLSGSELARRAHLSIPGVAASLAQMEEKGWVRRKPHRSHRRLLEVFLSAQGKRRLGRARQALRSVDGVATRGLSAPARAALKAALNHLSERLS